MFEASHIDILAAEWSLSPQWAFNRWLVAAAVLAAGAMVAYLYRAQQRVASRRVVAVLTALRLVLVLLAFVLLAGLGLRWKRTGASGGTLWVVVDRSGSMDHADPQATPLEKLRWADALGFLPPEARPAKLGRCAERLAAVGAELPHLRTRGELVNDPTGAARQAADFATALRGLGDRIRTVADELEHEKDSAAPALRAEARRMNDAADRAAKTPDVAQASRVVPWEETAKAVDSALTDLPARADAADQKFLADHAADKKVTEALSKVSTLSRAQLASLALATKGEPGRMSLADVVTRQRTHLVTFADTPQFVAVESASELIKALGPTPSAGATGQSTNMAAPLRYVAEHLGQDEPASVVFVGDGRQNAGGDLVEPARQLAARGVPVFALALGSQKVAPDAAVEQVDAPDWVYQDDTVRASALLRLDGLAGKPVTVEFYRGDRKIDSKSVTPSQERATQVISFSDKPPESGVFEYAVRIAEIPDEAVKENNRLGSRVSVKKDKLAVLLVDDLPRWEYRHLVNYLSRDNRVKLQTVLLQPARAEMIQRPQPRRASPKNEGVEAQLLPEKKEDWSAFDLVILGDVPKEALSEQDQQNLAASVKDRGTTLLLVAGPLNMPQRLAGTPLAELIPVELSTGDWASAALPDHLKKGFRPTVAPEGQASILSQFTIDEPANAALWAAMPPWYWHSEQTQAKRSASVLWSIGEAGGATNAAPASGSTDPARERALLATMSVGMGRVMYLASDSTWRLRQVNGQNPHERFWGQVIRWVVNNELPAGGKLVRFGTDKPRYVAGEPVVVTARLIGEDFAPLRGQKVSAVARAGESGVVARTELAELPDAPGYYRASLSGIPAGATALSLEGDVVSPLLDKDQVPPAQRTLALDVQSQLSVEQRNVNADRAAMARLAEAGGGFAADGPYADVLAENLPELNYTTETFEEVGLFADPNDRHTRLAHWAFLALFAAVASAEWVIRKAAGLV
jgi:hypothetical protein